MLTGSKEEHDKYTRTAIVDKMRCRPTKCNLECKNFCPVIKTGKKCIEVEKQSKICEISEILCIGCGICQKKCPFDAISIINLPTNFKTMTTHRYGPNQFKLHRLPIPRAGEVLGLVGANGTGKTTALKILAGKLKPNLGSYAKPPDWEEILRYFRGSELQNYFKKLLENKLQIRIKPQFVDGIPKNLTGTVLELLKAKSDRGNLQEILDLLELNQVKDQSVETLSGGELQRLAVALLCVQNADIYIFDEPTSYLDVKQRMRVAHAIRDLLAQKKYVVIAEHDLAVLDYLSDFVCVLYGMPACYGVVTLPSSVRNGINMFLRGKIPTENLVFRKNEIVFNISEIGRTAVNHSHSHWYPAMKKRMDNFELTVEPGFFNQSEIIVMLGENGTGKTTFIRMLAGNQKPDSGEDVPVWNVSYKPQKISPKFRGNVEQLLVGKISGLINHPQFLSDVMRPLNIPSLMGKMVQNLSGGELQRVGITLCLGKPADIYLLDEPSAYLDSEQRIEAARVIRRFILHSKKIAFVVEHDFIMSSYLADRVIVFDGIPALSCTASPPQHLVSGLNSFLKSINITYRRDWETNRPRINKPNSAKDNEQKSKGEYFLEGRPDSKDE